jgi:sodium/potassium-transporting ATPase subunit alpha
VVHISGAFSYYQEFKSDRIIESFKNMVPHFAYVVRQGIRVEIGVGDLVVGDIVEVKYGDLIPADLRILESQDFKVDNSSLTGESEPCRRSPQCTSNNPLETKNMTFFSTNALEGVAKAMVVRVGSNTLMGRLAKLASTVDAGVSPIGIEMDRFIMIMTVRSIVFGGLFFVLSLLMHYAWTDAIFFVIGIVVANVPEGLAVTFTMILAVTAKRMAKKNCLVKHLHAVEALGSTSVICTDKTGTLTQNKMSVAHMWFNNEIAEADTSEFFSGMSFNNDDPGFKALANVASLCSRAVFKPGQENVPVLKRYGRTLQFI